MAIERIENEEAGGSVRAKLNALIDKSGHYVDLVVDYGAVGDGVANDSAALRAALASFGAAGGVLFIPPGTYNLNSADGSDRWIARIPANVTVAGAGMGSTVLKVGASIANNAACLYSTGDNVTVRDLQVDGNKSRTGSAFNALGDGIDFETPGKNMSVISVLVKDCLGEGIDYDAVSGGLISGCVVQNGGGNGIHVADDSAELVLVTSCRTSGNAAGRRTDALANYAGYVLRGRRLHLSDCFSDGDYRCLDIEARGSILVTGFWGRTQQAAHATDVGSVARFVGTAGDMVDVTGCYFEKSGANDGVTISVDTAIKINFRNCTVRSTGAPSIMYFSAAAQVQVDGMNIIAPSSSHGFNFRDAAGTALLSGSRIETSSRAIRTRDGWLARVLSCHCTGSIDFETNNNVAMNNVAGSATDTGTGNILRNNVLGGSFVASGTS